MDANMQKSDQQSSSFDFDDIGCPMFPSEYKRLSAIKTRHLKSPRYKGDIWYIVKVLGYIGYRGHMDKLNKNVIISRPQMEAGWMRLLLRSYKNYNPTARAIEQGFEYNGKMESLLWWKQMMLNHAMWQKRGMHNNNRESPEEVENYWEHKAWFQPGLDIINHSPDTDADHAPQPEILLCYDQSDADDDEWVAERIAAEKKMNAEAEKVAGNLSELHISEEKDITDADEMDTTEG